MEAQSGLVPCVFLSVIQILWGACVDIKGAARQSVIQLILWQCMSFRQNRTRYYGLCAFVLDISERNCATPQDYLDSLIRTVLLPKPVLAMLKQHLA